MTARTDAARLLERLPVTYAQLGGALVPSGTSPDGERVTGGGGKARPAPARLEVADHRHQLLRGLRWWVAQADLILSVTPHTYGVRPRLDPERPAHLCAWLRHVLPTIPDPRVLELVDNLTTWTARARKVAADERPARLVPLPGACLASTDLWTCPGVLTLAVPQRGFTCRPWLLCRDCGGRWDVTELPEAADVPLPVHVAAELLGVSVRTVQRRATRDAGTVRLADVIGPDTAASPVAQCPRTVAHNLRTDVGFVSRSPKCDRPGEW